MKSIFLTLALTILATICFAQFPQSSADDSCCYVSKEIRAAIIDKEGSLVDVKIAKLPDDVVKIRVKSGNEIIHQTRVKKEEIVNLNYDLKNYPEGSYVFEIVRKNKIIYSRVIEFGNENYALATK